MLRLSLRRLRVPLLAALGLLLVGACTADPLQLEGRGCGPNGECVDGYVCNTATRICVRPGKDAGTGGSATGGTAGTAGAGGKAGTGGKAGSGGSAGSAGAGTGGTGTGGSGTGGSGTGGAGTGGAAGSGGTAGTGGSAGCPGVDTATDPLNCGACNRACSTAHVASVECQAGRCVSFCVAGYANCSQPAAPNPDDGCETNATSNTDCGGCGNTCNTQTAGGGLVCSGAQQCSCNANDRRCDLGGTKGVCDNSTGQWLCSCGGTLCRPGEVCNKSNGLDVCTCNNSAGCGAGQTCCQKPAQCVDLSSSATSCGACGHACPQGFACKSGVCGCTSDSQCNAGKAGTCDTGSGHCVCGGKTCSAGQRCQSNGSCG